MRPWVRIWKERRHIDLWTVNHTLSGALLAAIALGAGLSFAASFLSAALLAVAWEFFERYRGVGEALPNKVWDVVVALFGFIVYWRILLSVRAPGILVAATLSVWVVLQAWGLWALERMGNNPFTND